MARRDAWKKGDVCVTDKYKTSQTCIYCFEYLERLCFVEEKNEKAIKRSTKVSLMCVNLECVSVKHGRSTKSRDALSSLTIRLSVLTLCLLGIPILHFSQSKISQYETEEFKIQAFALLRCN
ncbi:uncharacterized protein B0P05DRAFT_58077 [Gilbertella persicaria]|uniref:uncharacterized protein n=1 Tax=Gilbertella persicaria TaxID=101096 RepID=UPI002220E01C|nr:uncharacterized protein B0P05DRAFT_58077 [Gilbertella persicaria]KAI8082580.1 hypothetical protein B0P05DRAFT_58077 [Gilbertella persicaria]